MQFQLNTDEHIQGTEQLAAWVETELKGKLTRFRDQLTRIEAHMSDANGVRVGDHDKRCKLEARMAGLQPVVVSHDAGTVADALHGAADKLLRALDSTVGKLRDAHGRDTIRGAAADAVDEL
ncbi:HPF/RaiA family ribosome-associated protein [Roseateles koreensis]|uniref:HPF/RaiA family ribosome-associated protein n=1 Tax=Roseateles koreensis TaxID=2987526 RepID=A0ABT5KM38_9BURK|nr:HPF/RaiA family ribosome-associated protein [Roseateles koreensis]MDC8783897.1 HPF/RaiA family ribosome-associated protein [Roseateles koreensis]